MKIQKVSTWSMAITAIVGALFLVISFLGNKQLTVMQTTTDQYILCEQSANNLQDASRYLTEQVRLYAMTGDREHMDKYFQEADKTGRRERALENLRTYFGGTRTFSALQKAMDYSQALMNTEFYSMRLVAEAQGLDESTWPQEIRDVTLSEADQALSDPEKLALAQKLVSDDNYQIVQAEITNQVTECTDSLSQQTHNRQNRAIQMFSDMYFKIEIGLLLLVILMLVICMMVRRLVVVPLVKCQQSVIDGTTFPVEGAAELQVLAETYNKVYQENQDAQLLIRHKAEHDALTDLLNRGSFEKLLKLYSEGEAPFALIIVDVDYFKTVNDTCGHAVGDEMLKKVADLLRSTFRSIDYVCRIGGDEFAIIMVEMTSDLDYTIQEKIDTINQTLALREPGLPNVSLSVGVAFSDRENPTGTLFEDADQALYDRKKHGKSGCTFYGKPTPET